MKEKDKIKFFDTSALTQTPGIKERCTVGFLQSELEKRIPSEKFCVTGVRLFENGRYRNGLNVIDGLPPFCEVVIKNQTGNFHEIITVWVPLAWNDRFAGTGGGGTSTGGKQYIRRAENTVRGLTLPYALINGFASATADGCNVSRLTDKAIDPETNELRLDLIENWRSRTTHHMAVFGKTTAEILHGRPVRFSYMNGGSGGGRQSFVEAQEHPEDFDGIWASCPAINWMKFLPCGFWPMAVMNDIGHVLSAKKLEAFMQAVHDSVGGSKAYYKLDKPVDFDARSAVGKYGLSEQDALVMNEIWRGLCDESGNVLCKFFRPGVKFWSTTIPVGAINYAPITHKRSTFLLCTHVARWITGDGKRKFGDITRNEVVELFRLAAEKFPNAGADNPDLSAFAARGGKIMADHGLNDPLIPTDGTIDYFKRVCASCGGYEKVDTFFRLWLTPGDGHGDCKNKGPGIPESAGMKALIDWVENGIAPDELRTIRVDKRTGELLDENTRKHVRLHDEY